MKYYADKINKEMFKDIVAFSISEPGAMGPNDMTFYKKNGDSFVVDYKREKTSYEKIKECFPSLNGCYWNGPMKDELATAFTIVIGGSENDRGTKVPNGYRHMYLDFGNHLAVKEEFYSAVKDIFKGKTNVDIAFNWNDILDKANFLSQIDDISKVYYEQKRQMEI